MTDRLDDVWGSRDYPVLREVTRRFDSGDHYPRIPDIADALEMEPETVKLAASALERRGLVELHASLSGPVGFKSVAGKAYVITGLHPDEADPVASLAAMLRAAGDNEPDDEERGRLRRAADALGSASGAVATGVLTAWLTGQLPGH